MDHVMIDLETMGTRPSAVICTVGAVLFDPDTEELGSEFYTRVEWESGQPGRTFDGHTVRWWAEQTPEAREEVFAQDGREPLAEVLDRLRSWLPEKPHVWGNGSTFDISILEHAYGYEPPWSFVRIRDVRTIVALADGVVPKPEMAEGTAHNALDDAKHQAAFVSAMWRELRRTQ